MADEPPVRARRGLPDLSKLYDSIGETKVKSTPDLPVREAAPEAESRVVKVAARAEPAPTQVSPELKTYLPPDLWRKLTGDTPRAGIYLNALDRLNSLLYTISTYLPGDLVQEKLAHPVIGQVTGKMQRGCLLFSDVSGFTALSERLAVLGPQGAEHLTSVINRYFTEMIDIIAWSNGTLLKFAGDATLIYFPEQENGIHAQWAARAGLRMLRAMSNFTNLSTPLGPVSLAMKLGLAAGPFLSASVGSAKRMEYGLLGATVSQTLQSEGNAVAGQLVTNQAAADLLQAYYEMVEVKPGFYLLKPGNDNSLDSFEIRPEKRRARRSRPWDATVEDLNTELNDVLGQIKALTPYLASELVDRIITHAYQRQVQSEYRPTTVMFCNFVGPENLLALWGESGVSRVTGLLSAYFNDMNDAITRFGGIVSRIDPYSQGTKLLALFGAPVAHEDDPQRAVNAALAMNSALQALNRRWAQKLARHLPPGSPENLIDHRIGITLGETFAGQAGSSTRREYTVMGDEVNLSARLMSAASPGQILVSEPVLERVDSYFVTRKFPPIRVKGKKKPIPIWQVDGPRQDTLLNRIRSRPALVGRNQEMERAHRVFDRARAGEVSLLTFTGPAGIGKSHICDTLLKQALDQDWQVQAFQCRAYLREEAYACWTGLLRSLAAITPIDHPLIQEEKLSRLMAELGLETTHTETMTDFLGLRQAQQSQEIVPDEETGDSNDPLNLFKQKKATRRGSSLDLFGQLGGMNTSRVDENVPGRKISRQRQALSALLVALAARGPLVIFFEDFQWMDKPSKEFLAELQKELAAQPILFLLAGRSQEKISNTGKIIELDPFTRSETRNMVAAILTAGLADIIHEQSNGSPLFVEEISRWLRRTYSIDESGLKNVLQSSDVLQKLVLSSLETLPESQREVARLAAVVGMDFHPSDVEALLDDPPDPVTLNKYLSSLVDARLVSLSGAGADPQYTFVQSIFRDILYTSLPFERRRELHIKMAEHIKSPPSQKRQVRDKISFFLDEGVASNPLGDLERLAYHYEMSEQWLAAARELLDSARTVKSAEQTTVESFYSRALALLEHYPPEKIDSSIALEKIRAYMGLGDIALLRSELPSASAAFESAAAIPCETLPSDLSFGLAARRALALPSQGRQALAEKQLATYIEQHPDCELWKLHALQAWHAWRAGHKSAQLVAACQAELPDSGSKEIRRMKALLEDLAGNWETAAGLFQRLEELSSAALALVRRGDAFLRLEDSPAARQHYEMAAEIWQKLESNCGIALTHYRRAELLWREQHDTRQTISILEESLSELEKSPLALQPEPRAVVQKALMRIKSRKDIPWGDWQWQPLEDLARIHLLLPIF